MPEEDQSYNHVAAFAQAIHEQRRRILAGSRQHRAQEDALRAGFEGRLHRLYKQPLELFDTIYLAIYDKVNSFCEVHLPEAREQQDAAFVVQFQLYVRASLTTTEIRTLLRAGLATGALARWRTMYELTIIGHFIADRNPLAAERYYFHDRMQAADLIELGGESVDEHIRQHFHEIREEWVGKYGPEIRNNYGWASPYFRDKNGQPKQRPTFKDIERKVFEQEKYKDMFQLVKSFYQVASNANHATSQGNSMNIQNPFHDHTLVAGPSMAGLGLPAMLALKSFLHSATLLFHTRSGTDITPFLVATDQLIEEMSSSFSAIDNATQASGLRWRK